MNQFANTWLVPRGWQRIFNGQRKQSPAPSVNQSFDQLSTVMADDWEPFRRAIAESETFVEYGGGESSIYADRLGVQTIFTVETDYRWVNLLRERVSDRVTIFHSDLGPVTRWGRPASFEARSRFSEYREAPFKANLRPTLVLIDGRFRVATFLTAMLFLEEGGVVIFDDYVTRQEYHIVEEVLIPVEVGRRQARFERPRTLDTTKLREMIRDFAHVMD